MIRRRALPAPPGSRLAHERLWFLGRARDVGNHRPARAATEFATLRGKVDQMMVTAQSFVQARMRYRSYTARLRRLRWVDEQPQLAEDDQFSCPWPTADQPHRARNWAWRQSRPN
jgi:hypothetical protein